MKNRLYKFIIALMATGLVGASLVACGDNNDGGGEEVSVEEQKEVSEPLTSNKMTIDTSVTYQTIESFGTSGCWWSQYVGGFDKTPYDDGEESRVKIAKLLFDKEEGIGLTSYRYNLGAGSAQSNKGTYSDHHRRAQCFLNSDGEYDFTKDAKAVWFLEEAVSLGVNEVTFFCNSPLEIYTINGTAQTTKGELSNISEENYAAWANYCYDVCEHFIDEGIPVKFLSPINEPQWEWTDSQEGCHYEPDQVKDVFLAFLEELEKRPELYNTIKLSGPESGEWGGEAKSYTSVILNNEKLGSYFDTIDNHSYWSDSSAKKNFKNFMKINYPDVKLRMSEWCEMVNGSDFTMDSAYHLAEEIAEDLRILDVVSWTNWVGVAPGGYRDGLIYIDEDTQKFKALKRLWSFGNYSRYVRPGYVRVDLTANTTAQDKMLPTAFTGVNEDGKEELVMVYINENEEDQIFYLEGVDDYQTISYYVTSDDYDLECTYEGTYSKDEIVTIPKSSVTTVILRK